MSFLRMFVSLGRKLMSLGGVLARGLVVLAMVLGGLAMRFRRILVMIGGGSVLILSHDVSSKANALSVL